MSQGSSYQGSSNTGGAGKSSGANSQGYGTNNFNQSPANQMGQMPLNGSAINQPIPLPGLNYGGGNMDPMPIPGFGPSRGYGGNMEPMPIPGLGPNRGMQGMGKSQAPGYGQMAPTMESPGQFQQFDMNGILPYQPVGDPSFNSPPMPMPQTGLPAPTAYTPPISMNTARMTAQQQQMAANRAPRLQQPAIMPQRSPLRRTR